MNKILYVLVVFLIMVYLCNTVRESYYPTCPKCGGRVVTAQVFASPDHLAGLGWNL
jgi:hypothetical protein